MNHLKTKSSKDSDEGGDGCNSVNGLKLAVQVAKSFSDQSGGRLRLLIMDSINQDWLAWFRKLSCSKEFRKLINY